MMVLREVANRLGTPPHGWSAVFPLNPSMMRNDWFADGGPCALRRILQACYGWDPTMNHYVYRGRLVDAVVSWGLNLKRAGGEEPTADQAVSQLYQQHEALAAGYDLQGLEVPVRAWLFTIENLIRAFWRGIFPRLQAVLVQQKHWLWIGEGELPTITPEYGDPNWVTGKSDWIEKVADGFSVHDLKVMAKLLTRGSRKFFFQLGTYAAAMEQQGCEVVSVVLDMLDWKTMAYDADPTLWTSPASSRTVGIYRAARDHYSAALAGKSELLIPVQGNGQCTQRNCGVYRSCPYGMGQPWTGRIGRGQIEV